MKGWSRVLTWFHANTCAYTAERVACHRPVEFARCVRQQNTNRRWSCWNLTLIWAEWTWSLWTCCTINRALLIFVIHDIGSIYFAVLQLSCYHFCTRIEKITCAKVIGPKSKTGKGSKFFKAQHEMEKRIQVTTMNCDFHYPLPNSDKCFGFQFNVVLEKN